MSGTDDWRRGRPLLVLGGSGQVGGCVLAEARRRYGPEAAVGTCLAHPAPGLVQADLQNPEELALLVAHIEPAAVIIAAAFAWVDGCEMDAERTRRTNVDGPRAVATACEKLGAVPVLLGTDYVFDGEAGPYSEDDPVRPISAYGRSKLDAERAVAGRCPAALLVRTNVVYSWLPAGNNFLMQVVTKLGKGEPMRVPADQSNNPTYAPDLARALCELLEARAAGVWHFGGGDFLDRHDFGVAIAQAFDLDASLLHPVTTQELKQPAARPLKSGLRTTKFEALTGRRPFTASEGIARALALSRGDAGA
ncbi:MAG: SDR family oxidoreductase [Candidatus Wallbacteria bacterium]|nr:SDR family oxidoreductase [Candidatus Wallbacteria bacterium]